MVDLLNKYFVIENSDGDTTVTQLTREQLLKKLTPDPKYGDVEIDGSRAIAEVPGNGDTNYWGDGFLIIKGHVVTPRAVETVTEYDI